MYVFTNKRRSLKELIMEQRCSGNQLLICLAGLSFYSRIEVHSPAGRRTVALENPTGRPNADVVRRGTKKIPAGAPEADSLQEKLTSRSSGQGSVEDWYRRQRDAGPIVRVSKFGGGVWIGGGVEVRWLSLWFASVS